MKAHIDMDMIVYQAAFTAQFKEKDEEGKPTGETIILPFDAAKDAVDKIIADIVDAVGATEYTLHLTGKGNFREEIAKRQPYKDSREEKPFHYANVKAYAIHSLGSIVWEGMEADDAMAIAQWADWNPDYSPLYTIICSRDKDLRMVPGWHYSWECYNQAEKTPYFVDELGEFQPQYKQTVSKKTGKETTVFKKLEATGLCLFYSQILTGDKVDDIPGLPGVGGKGAYDALKDCLSEKEMYLVCLGLYEEAFPERGYEELLEQARLVWMVRELDAEGKPIMWEPPDGCGTDLS